MAGSHPAELSVVIHVTDASGKPVYQDGRPQTMTLARAPRPLPDGARFRIDRQRAGGAPLERARAESYALADHVRGWDGVRLYGRPAPCTRHLVACVLEEWPHIRRQVEDAVKFCATVGA